LIAEPRTKRGMKPTEIFRIYLTDDDREDRELFAEALDDLDCKVLLRTFEKGSELLDCLMLEPELPDIIFLDLLMPVFDGEMCTVEIRKHKRFDRTPIVIYSTVFDMERIEQLFILGANRYLQKSSSYPALVSSLGRVLDYAVK